MSLKQSIAQKERFKNPEEREKISVALKGCKPWNKGKKCPQSSEAMKGKNNPMYGKHHSEETKYKIGRMSKGKKRPPFSKEWRENLSKAMKGRIPWNKGVPRTEEEKMKMSKARKGKCKGIPTWNKGLKTGPLSEEHKMKVSEGNRGKVRSEEMKKRNREMVKALWKDPEFKKRMREKLETSSKCRPTKPEKVFNELTPDSVRYVGNGKWWRDHHNPDFKITGQNKVIEIYGDYWHRKDDPKIRIREYKEIGLDCIIFWESEVYGKTEQVIKKTLEFISN